MRLGDERAARVMPQSTHLGAESCGLKQVKSLMAADQPRASRKARVRAWKEDKRVEARTRFPLSDQQLSYFFERLDAIWPSVGCTHNLRSSEAVAREMSLNDDELDALFDWCNEHGGYCDCEVAANTRDYWESNRART